MVEISLEDLLKKAADARIPAIDEEHRSALRLFAGFYEGEREFVADLYARTLVLQSFSALDERSEILFTRAQCFYLELFPWLNCVIQKKRQSADSVGKRGKISFGDTPDTFIFENGVFYAIDLTMNQDTSFYLDTRSLRQWLKSHCRDITVLNTFAYTGSLGVAALAGGASRVVQVDRSSKFMSLARQSAMLNHSDLGKMKLQAEDFFTEVGKMKKEGALFDLGVLDPPFFSTTEKGTVNQVADHSRLINKLRPLIKDGGRLIAINNALFLSGREYMSSLDSLCRDGYLSIGEIIPVPEDITGFAETIVTPPPTDPSPFNAPTKIVILRVKRK